MLIRLREIVEKVAGAPSLPEALELLVNETSSALDVEACSIFLADAEQKCFYLMATKGLNKPRGRIISIDYQEGIVGLVGRLAEPINLADAQRHPEYKFIPQIKEAQFRAILGVPIIYRRELLGVLLIQKREAKLFSESEESFMVTLATQLAGVFSQSQIGSLFGRYRKTRIRAVAASPGVAVAPGWQDTSQPSLETIHKACSLDTEKERGRLATALEDASAEFRRFSKRFNANAQKESAAIFDLYTHLLNDPRLKGDLFAEVDKGHVAEWAVKDVIERLAARFTILHDPYMRDRASDLKALGQRLVFHLDDNIDASHQWPQRFVLVAEELTATLLAEVPQDRVAGIVVREGAANSHAAILVRAMGVPTVMGADVEPELLNHRLLVVDGYRGELLVDPEPTILREYQRLINESKALDIRVQSGLNRPAELKSGERIQIMLNAGLSAEHERLLEKNVDGVGLYRTEIPFMLQSGFPSEEEQTAQYQGMLRLYPNKSVSLRTLDVGADKPLPYLPINEENPSLGWRGIRITLDQPEIFLVQVRAMLRASLETKNLGILLPMITNIDEIDEAKRLIDRAINELDEIEGYAIPRPRIGIMLEVPSMIFMIPHLMDRIDFISVGTNDLTQYLLAVDRNNTHVASLYDSLNPAILQALRQIVLKAEAANISLSLCGEMAGDPMGALLLVGLGFKQFSMNARSVPHIKYLLRHVDFNDAQALAHHAMRVSDTAQVRELTSDFMSKNGLGSFISAQGHKAIGE